MEQNVLNTNVEPTFKLTRHQLLNIVVIMSTLCLLLGFIIMICFPFVAATVTINGRTGVERIGLFFGGSGSVAELVSVVFANYKLNITGIYTLSLTLVPFGLLLGFVLLNINALNQRYKFKMLNIISIVVATLILIFAITVYADVQFITKGRVYFTGSKYEKVMQLYHLSITGFIGLFFIVIGAFSNLVISTIDLFNRN